MQSRLVHTLMIGWLALIAPAGGIAAPSPADVLRASNDRIHRFVLDNGMIGLVKEDHSAPVVAIQIWVGTGAIHEDQYLGAGLSHYVEHMIFKGTPTRTTGDISRQIDDAGGSVNAYTSSDRTVFHVVMPSARWEAGLDVLADAVMNANFPDEEWRQEQTVILREMAMGRDDARRELSKLLWATAYRVHPYRHPIIGYEEVFIRTTREDLLNFFHRHYTPDNMIFALAGDVDALEAEQKIRTAFAAFERRMRPPVVIPAEPPQLAPRFARKTGDYNVSRLGWAYHTVPLSHPDAAALDVLAAIVGQGDSARLTREVRDRQQLAHSISAWSFTPGEPGLFGISATFDPDKEDRVIEAIQREIDRWAEAPFTEDELAKARRQVMVGALADLQTMRGQVDSIASGEYYAGDPRFSERYIERVEAVTASALQDVAARYLRTSNRTLALLTPKQAATETADAGTKPLMQPPVRIELNNGTPLIVREDHRLPFVHVSVAFLGGLLSEQDDNQGITQFMADLLTRGTETRSAQEIAEQVESLGAGLSAFSGQNSFGMQAMALTDDLDAVLEIMADCLMNSVFPDEEMTRQRARQIADIRAQRERPFFHADEMVRQALYPNHPYRWTTLGDEASVGRLTREDLTAHLERHRVRGNMAISMFGHITPEEARARAEQFFRDVPPGDKALYRHDIGDVNLPLRVKKREPRQQTIYLMAFPGVTLTDEKLDAMTIMQSALSGLSSEIGMEIREKRGLVYFVGAFQRTGLDPGVFVLYAGTYEEAVPEVERLMEAEVERLITDGLTGEEIARAQEQLVGAHYAALQDNGGLAQVSALNELYGLGYDYAFTTEERVRAVTADDIRRAAREILIKNRRVISIVYPERPTPAQEETEDHD